MTWCNDNILKDFFKKYDLKLGKVELIDFSKPLDQFQIKVKQREEELGQSYLNKIRIYREKELNNVSDRSYQAFINAGATNFASMREVKVWRNLLNTEFNLISNSMGTYVSPSKKIKYYIRLF